MSKSVDQIKSINHHLRHAIEQVGEGILIIEAESSQALGPKIVFANRAAALLTGYEQKELIGQSLGFVYDPDFLKHLVDRLPTVAESGGLFSTDKLVVKKGGEKEPFRWTISGVRDGKGRTVNFTLTLRPVSIAHAGDAYDKGELAGVVEKAKAANSDQQIEDSLEKSRVESLALLAGGIAHDFNNVLTSIVSNLSLARMETVGNSQVRSYIDLVREAATEAQSLAQQILDFTKGRQPMIQAVLLGNVLQQVTKMALMGTRVKCDPVVQEGLWPVEVDLRQIRQVLHNLIINACQAMKNGGVVQARVENILLAEDSPIGLPGGQYVVLRVRDRGCGISEENIAKIFEPYYTTKKNGTGIGLATCKAIIQRHRGAITVHSKPNVGTEFRVYLPKAKLDNQILPTQEPNGADTGQRDVRNIETGGTTGGNVVSVAATGKFDPGQIVGGDGSILVVDDQNGVREAAERLLQKIGYRPIGAADGQEAVSLYRQRITSAEPFQAVLLDMTLPGGLSGDEVMEEIRKVDPRATVIATSGWFDEDAEERFRSDGYAGILPKPYAVEKLSQKLAEAIRIGG